MRVQKQQQGFTLIEIMIVVTIIAILTAFAYPSYVQQVRKSKRVDATVALQELLQKLQKSFAGALQELYKSCTGALQELYRNPRGALQEPYRISTGGLQEH